MRKFIIRCDALIDRLEADIEAHLEMWSLGMSEAKISADVEKAALEFVREMRQDAMQKRALH